MITNPPPSICFPVPKTTDETVSNSAVLQADNELTFPVVAGAVYTVEAHLHAVFGAGHISVGFSGPATNFASIRAQLVGDGHQPAMGATSSLATGIPLVVSSPVQGMLEVDAAFSFSESGTLSLIWAQNTSDAAATTVKAGSFLTVNRVL